MNASVVKAGFLTSRSRPRLLLVVLMFSAIMLGAIPRVRAESTLGTGILIRTIALKDIQQIVVDRIGNIYVFDESSPPIREYSPTGKLLASWGTRSYPPNLGAPYLNYGGMGVDPSGNLVVSSGASDNVIEIARSGKVLARWSVKPQHISQADGLTVDRHAEIYLVDSQSNWIAKYSASGRPLAHWRTGDINGGGSTEIGVDSHGSSYVSIVNRGFRANSHTTVQKFSPTGAILSGWKLQMPKGNDFEPLYPFVDRNDNLFVVDDKGNRILKYTLAGKLLRAWAIPRNVREVGSLTVRVSDSGTMYLADHFFRRPAIFILSSSGRLSSVWIANRSLALGTVAPCCHDINSGTGPTVTPQLSNVLPASLLFRPDILASNMGTIRARRALYPVVKVAVAVLL